MATAGTARNRNQTPPPSKAAQPPKCDSCGNIFAADAKFCRECGVKRVPKCPSCGNIYASDSKFCRECGVKRADVPEDAAPVSSKEKPGTVDKAPASTSEPGLKFVLAALFVALLACGAAMMYGPEQAEVVAAWNSWSKPLEKWLVNHADLMVALAALPVFGPLALLVAVTGFRAALDLRHLNTWQKVLLGLLVGTALATLFMEGQAHDFVVALPGQAIETWTRISGPLEDFLVRQADNVIAGAALVTFLPLGVLLVGLLVRAVWGCRVRLAQPRTVKA